MVSCCVPFCKSSHRNAKELGISFHEFPCDADQRRRWILNIHRKDWIIRDKTTVCSLHFTPSDYKNGMKTRMLKKGAVPTVFKGYPAYLQAAAAKPLRPPPKARLPYKKLCRKQTGSPININKNSNNNNDDDYEPVATVDTASISVDTNTTQLFCDTPTRLLPAAAEDTTSRPPPSPPREPVSCNCPKVTPPPPPSSLYRSTLGRIPMTPDALCRSRRNIQMQNYYLKRQVKSLRTQLETLRSKLRRHEDSASDTVNADAQLGCEQAIFLKDQLKAYNSKQARWSPATVQLCLMWQQESARGYEFVRKSKCLCLPSRNTLKRWANAVIGQGDVVDSVEEKTTETHDLLTET